MFADHVIRRWCKISTQDEMFDPLHVRHYFRVGLGALDCINNSLAVTGKTAVHRILDFGCGHGRILRHLTKAFPDARITATDINRDGVDFCERTFGALGVYSDTSAATVDFHDTFDLIWAGTVLTNIEPWDAFLRLLRSSLDPDGVLVLTTHGPDVEQKIQRGERDYGLDPHAVESILTGYAETGFGYGDYPGMSGYGIAVAERTATYEMLGRAGLRVVRYTPIGWDNHQDVYACVPAASVAA
jgi:SAM-dependent methyltransferase